MLEVTPWHPETARAQVTHSMILELPRGTSSPTCPSHSALQSLLVTGCVLLLFSAQLFLPGTPPWEPFPDLSSLALVVSQFP